MSFFVLPPEINSLRMFIGAGTAPMLQAASAWEGLADELGSAAQSFASVTAGLAGQAWQGQAAAAMAAAAAPYATWLTAAAAQSFGAAGQARAVASMFEAAQAATVLPQAVAANRDAFVRLVLSNLFGQNAPAIAAAEGLYEEMWAADVAAMSGYYSGASAVAAQVVPWTNILKGLPGLVAGAGGTDVGNGAAGASTAGTSTGAGTSTASSTSGNASGGSAGGTNNVVSETPSAGAYQASPTYGNVGQGSSDGGYVGSASLLSAGSTGANVGVGSTGMLGAPVPIPVTGGNQTGPGAASPSTPTSEKAGAATRAPETPAPPPPQVEAPSPHLGVLPTADPELAAKAAPAPVTRATPSPGAGIPESALRPSRAAATSRWSGTKQDQHASEEVPAEEVKVPSLRPEAEAGQLRPRAKQDPGIQVRGG